MPNDLSRRIPRPRAPGLQAYADGVNAWVKRNPLPLQYAALEITKFQPWTALDCAVIGKALAFQLSFDLDTGATSDFQTYAAKLGAPLAQALFFGDVFRSAPFDKAASVPDATGTAPFLGGLGKASASSALKSSAAATSAPAVTTDVSGVSLDAAALRSLRNLRNRYEAVPFLKNTLDAHRTADRQQ